MTRPSTLEEVLSAIRSEQLVVIPTDTVYGLACTPFSPEAARALSLLKQRAPEQPVALVAASVDALVECVPELRGRLEAVVRALVPGPLTLVLPNPARRLGWLTASRPDTIGVRVPRVTGVANDVLVSSEIVAATSANLHGGSDPRTLADVPREILAGAAAALDGGELPGAPSTVVDLTTPEPVVLREGAVPAADVLARAAAVLAE